MACLSTLALLLRPGPQASRERLADDDIARARALGAPDALKTVASRAPAAGGADTQAAYVGIAACAECHAAEHESYAHTPHSRALADLDPALEPPDVNFFHAPSGRTYSVYRAGGQLRHREAALDADGQECVASDYPIRYLVGSGHFSRSYLVEVDGFLLESPLTWYASRQAWGMSPGYDRANHRGFERPAESTCLVCHVGRLAEPDKAYQRLTITEQAIGCERCHGPGSLHVAERRGAAESPTPSSSQRALIVNPARLSRDLNEAICAMPSDRRAMVYAPVTASQTFGLAGRLAISI